MQTPTNQFITFKLAGEHYAINVSQVREVLDLTEITRIPGSPSFVRGVVNVRGQAIPVLDLRLRFGLPQAEPSIHTRIIVMEIDQGSEPPSVVGGLADSVHEVIELAASDLIAPPRLSATSGVSDCILGMGRRGDHFIVVLDAGSELFAPPSEALI